MFSEEYSHINEKRKSIELRGATFTPEIGTVSKVIAEARNYPPKFAHDRLLESGKATEQRKEIFRNMKDQLEKTQCSFSPRIDPV